MKIVFFGTPLFAARVLSDMMRAGVEVVAVVSKPDRPKGRSLQLMPTPVKEVVLEKFPEIPLYQPEKVSTGEFQEVLASYKADLFVVVAFGEIIRQELLDLPKLGAINLHTSLLPKYRGAAPIQRAIMAGEKETGVTIIRMVKKMDAGAMIATLAIPIHQDATFGEVEELLCIRGSALLIDVIHQFEEGKIKDESQDESHVTFAPKVELEECEINWSDPAEKIHDLIRGVNPYPGAFSFVIANGEKKRLKIWKSEVVREAGKEGDLVQKCGEGYLRLLEVQLEGKKKMAAKELMRGLSHLQF